MKQTFLINILLAISLGIHSPLFADVADPFPRPSKLKPDINFWKRVFTEVDTNHGLIHDNRHLDVVYEVISLPKNVSKRTRNRLIERAKERYKKILLKLSKGQRKRLQGKEKQVLKLWPKNVSNKTLKAAAYRLRFQLGQADRFRAGLIRSGAWHAYIKKQLREQGLPEGLAALPHVESSFNPEAYSHVGAAGIWQFTRSTGRRFMRVDHIVDERMDPYKSSEAAARLLKYNYTLLGSWPLAITAYNHGAAGMRQAVRKLGTKNIATILRRYKSRTFGFASRNFYVAFLAAMEVDMNPRKYFGPLKRSPVQKIEIVKIPAYVTTSSVEKALGIDSNSLKKYNPGLRPSVWNGEKLIPKGYELRVKCQRKCGTAAAAFQKIKATERFDRQIPDRYYKVRRGDSLSRIASKYRISIQKLLELNSLRSRHHIRIGQVLRLPTQRMPKSLIVATAHTPLPRPSSPSASVDGKLYRIQPGDTIGKIAQRYGLNEDKLAAENNIRNKHSIYPGQTLRLAARTSSTNSLPTPRQSATGAAIGSAKVAALAPRNDINGLTIAEQTHTDVVADDLTESVDTDDTAPLGPSLPSEQHPELSADPSDYTVSDNGTIEVQAAETLGHYADWLEIPTQRLRKINKLPFRKSLPVGKHLKLDFSKVDPESFERRRTAYHQEVQAAFFARYQISDTRVHVVKRGESLWALTHRKYKIPVWLLRQHNPDLNLYDVRPGMKLVIPELAERRESGSMDSATST